MESKILKKYYSKEDNLFHVVKNNPKGYFYPDIEETYNNFDNFYKAIKKDLKNADLLYYNFDDCNPLTYDLSKAIISSETMKKIGNYDNKFEKLIHEDKDFKILNPTMDIVESRHSLDLSQSIENDEDVAICYISDLHINHKLIKQFPNSVNKQELKQYLTSLVLKI